jgi:hypothetical protein
MIPVWAIMAAAGAAKDQLVDKPKEQRDRMLAAQTQRYAPWTGLQAQPIQEGSTFGSALQGGMAGLEMQQNMEKAKSQAEMQKSIASAYRRPGEPASWEEVRPTLYGDSATQAPMASRWSGLSRNYGEG